MQGCAVLACDSLHVYVLLDQCFTDVSVTLVCGEVQRVPLVSSLGVDFGSLKHLFSRVDQVKHLLHAACLGG